MPEQADGVARHDHSAGRPKGGWQIWALLVVGCAITALAVTYTKSSVDSGRAREFSFVCDQILLRTVVRVLAHEQILRSTAAFVEHATEVSRDDWRRYTERNRDEQQLPGIQGLGFALRIPRADLPAHLATIRAEGFPAYVVLPPGDRETYSAIIYLEPFTGRNLRAFGYDMLSEVTRRAAMERARDEDVAALSGKVTLVQETSLDVQAGTLMYVPVYRRDLPTSTAADRRAALRGWVYSPYRMRDLMQSIMSEWDVENERRIRLELFDDAAATPAALLYDSQPSATQQPRPLYTLERRMVAAGRPWTLSFSKTGRDPFGGEYAEVWLVLCGGLSTTLLLAGLLFNLLNVRLRAGRLAWQLTTELRENDAKLREVNLQLEKARESAEAASVAKTRFLAGMSHEMRTPLNSILGFAQVIARDFASASLPTEYARTIIRNSDHLSRLINDVLDMSKIEAGQVEVRPVVFSLRDLLDDVKTMFYPRALSKGLRFVVEIDPSVPHEAQADDGKVRQVLLNLLGNAVKFTTNGEVRLRVRATPLGEPLAAGTRALSLVMEIEDTGAGIGPDEVGQLFNAFAQTEQGAKAGGAGLGLSISRRLADAMGGTLTVQSALGKGSTFRFSVPVSAAGVVALPEKVTPRRIVGLEPGTRRVRILVVDDAADNRSLLRAVLGAVGFEIIEAEDGAQALETFARTSPEAVLMDMRMPVMDGYEATRRLRATEAGRSVLIAAVTAIAFDDARQEVMDTGVDACLTKPVEVAPLFELLRTKLDLTYVYSDDSMRPSAPPIVDLEAPRPPLPDKLLGGLRLAVADGDVARLHELIDEVALLEGNAAERLRAMADQYDYEQLTAWLA